MSLVTVLDSAPALAGAIVALDAKGDPTTLTAAVPVWSSSDDKVAAVAAAIDGMTAVVTPGNPGTATITVMATNADGSIATGSADLAVLPGAATSITVTLTPNAAPAPAPAPPQAP